MSNPFDDEDGLFLVLVNTEAQHSLWPANIAVPSGWDVTFGPSGRQPCLSHISDNWHDIRPASLIKADEKQIQEAGS